MANYVKFMRGSPAAYEQLKTANQLNNDTLYFIYREDALDGELYLGSKLIAGAEGLTSLNDIEISSEGLKDKQVLAYDAGSGKWVNITLEEAVNAIFVGATVNSAGVAGLVPPPAAGQTNLFLRSDGTWQSIEVSNSTTNGLIRTIENKDATDHSVIIAQNTADIIAAFGDIIIIKDLIIDDKWQHTAYIYNGSNWVAMDGNYNVESIYFNKDLSVTTPVGSITQEMIDKGNGIYELSASGKNIQEVLTTLLVEKKNPMVEQPTITLSAIGGNGEVGTSYNPPVATLTVTNGSYSYGSMADEIKHEPEDTGVIYAINAITLTESTLGVSNNSISNDSIIEDGSIALKAYGNTSEIFTDEDITYDFDGSAIYTTSNRVPVNNIGDKVPTLQIGYDQSIGAIQNTVILNQATTVTYSGWRKMFVGTVDEYNDETGAKTPIAITSDIIRNLNLVSKQVTAATQTFTVPVGATKIIVACPEEYSLAKCEYFTMAWETIENFSSVADVEVADARGGSNGLKNYHVYVFEHANVAGFEVATQYRITLKKG